VKIALDPNPDQDEALAPFDPFAEPKINPRHVRKVMAEPLPKTQGEPFLFFQSKKALLVTAWPHLESYIKPYRSEHWTSRTPSLRIYPDGPMPVHPNTFWQKQHEEGIGHLETPQWVVESGRLKWAQTLPVGLARSVVQYPGDRWRYLFAAAKVPGWLELSQSFPVLACLIANCEFFDDKNPAGRLNRMRRYITLPVQQTLEEFHFQSAEAAVPLLRKTETNSCFPSVLVELRKRMRTADLCFLEAAPCIDLTLMKILRSSHLKRVCTPELVAEMFALYGQEFFDPIITLYQFSPDELPASFMRLRDDHPNPPAFRSIAEMQDFVSRYSEDPF